MKEHTYMKEQTYQNIMYLAGLEALQTLAKQMHWNDAQYEAAQSVLEQRFQPTIVQI